MQTTEMPKLALTKKISHSDEMARKKNVDKSPGERTTITIEGDTADLVRAVCAKYRRTQKEFVEFAAKWLLSQPEELAGPIMGCLPTAYTSDFAKMALTHMARGAEQIPSRQSPGTVEVHENDPDLAADESQGGSRGRPKKQAKSG